VSRHTTTVVVQTLVEAFINLFLRTVCFIDELFLW
jgi:hypothetical protein